MKYEAKDINELCLCVIRKNKWRGNLELGYIPLEEFNQTAEQGFLEYLSTYHPFSETLEFVEKSAALKPILSNYQFCNILAEAFEEIPSIQDFEKSITPDIDKKMEESELIEYAKKVNRYWKMRLLAYKLDLSYAQCRKNEKELLAFSHRIIGFYGIEFDLDDNFSIKYESNFGYGRSSYFFCHLIYKNIIILPYSKWVEFRHARAYRIIRYGFEFELENERWEEALELGVDAFNLYKWREDEFVKKYIINELEEMVKGLEKILTDDKPKALADYHGDYKQYELMTYRAEKIAGALEFVNSILSLDGIIEISNFINRLELCNEKLLPQLVNNIGLINNQLELLLTEEVSLKREQSRLRFKYHSYRISVILMYLICLASSEEYEIYQLSKEEFKEKHPLCSSPMDVFNNSDMFESVENLFREAFPDFKGYDQERWRIQNAIYKTSEPIRYARNALKEIKDYRDKVASYFAIKSA